MHILRPLDIYSNNILIPFLKLAQFKQDMTINKIKLNSSTKYFHEHPQR